MSSLLPLFEQLAGDVFGAAVRWTPVLIVALVVARMARSTKAAFRHALWCAVLLALAAMLPLSAVLPRWRLQVGAADGWTSAGRAALARIPGAVGDGLRELVDGGVASGAASTEGVPASRQPAASTARVAWVWAGGVVFLLLRGAMQRARAGRLVRAASPVADRGVPSWPPAVRGGRRVALRAAEVRIPGVVGILRPTVLLPLGWEAWPRPWLEAALAHEVAHVERGDLRWHLLARSLRALFWFHPGVWLVVRELGAEAERACDERAVEAGLDRVTYAEALVQIAAAVRSGLPAPALAVVGGGRLLLRRVRGLLASSPVRRRNPSPAWLAPLVLPSLLLAGGELELRASLPADGGLPLERIRGGDGWLLRCSAGDVVCANATHQAVRLLRGSPHGGVALVADVDDGRVDGYASLGGDGALRPAVPRLLPGSLAKLALAAAWWESGLGDVELPCPNVARTSAGLNIRTAAHAPRTLRAPHEMLVFSCNSAAVALAGELAERGGSRALPAAMAPLLAGDAMTAAGADLASLARSPGVDWEAQAAGIGPLVTSPLEVARLVQAAGNGGVATAPWASAAAGGRAEPRRLFGPRTASRLRDAFADTVERGTAHAGAEVLGGAPWRLGGKTATIANEDGTVDGWFAGLLSDPEGTPRRVLVVWLRAGGPGGIEPAKLAARLGRAVGG